MSLDGSVNGDGVIVTEAIDKPFYCYECNCTVEIIVNPSSDPYCPICNGEFIEECENSNPNPGSDFLDPNPNPNPNPFSDSSLPDPFSSLLPLLSTMNSSSPSTNLFGSTRSPRDDPWSFLSAPDDPWTPRDDPLEFDPFTFIQNHINGLRSSGANIEFVIQNNPSEPGFQLPANIGDYFVGPGLEELIQQLAENDPNRYGTPPASKSAIDSLPTVEVTKDHLNSKYNQCAVCMDDFEEGIQAKRMPCKHLYHKDCILPWLELHNSCPVCRHELPTDDPDYERRVRGAQGTTSGGNDGVDRSAGDNLTAEMSFRISLPWPFQTRASGSGSADNAENMQEDLD